MLVKDIIEVLQKLDPTSRLWVRWSDKNELEDYFVEGCEINDRDWEEFTNTFEGDWDYVADHLSDVMNEGNTKNVYCDRCSLYDYECYTDENERETICRHCGEEEDLLND
jgi:hypothetical protein